MQKFVHKCTVLEITIVAQYAPLNLTNLTLQLLQCSSQRVGFLQCSRQTQHCNSATLQQCNTATVQQCQQCNTATMQYCNNPTVQHCNTATLQQLHNNLATIS